MGNYVMNLQQEMMDNGWQAELQMKIRGNNISHTQLTTVRTFTAIFSKVLSTAVIVCMLPMVPRAEDPKGLGCSFVLTPGTGSWTNRNKYVAFILG